MEDLVQQDLASGPGRLVGEGGEKGGREGNMEDLVQDFSQLSREGREKIPLPPSIPPWTTGCAPHLGPLAAGRPVVVVVGAGGGGGGGGGRSRAAGLQPVVTSCSRNQGGWEWGTAQMRT